MKRTMLKSLQIIVVVVFAGWANFLLASDWRVGDVFVGIGNGQYKVFDEKGLKETISDGQGGLTGGCAFDSTYHLVTTNISNAKVLRYKIDHLRGCVGEQCHGLLLQASDPTSPTSGAGSVVSARNGDFYVGSPGSPNGDGFIRKYDRAGTLLATYPVAVENSGSNWIDLSADGVIFYTSEGRLIKRFNVSGTGQQLPDFADLGNAGGPNFRLFALRLLPPEFGGLLVADKKNIKRLNSLGAVVKEYDAAGQNDWRFLSLDPIQPSGSSSSPVMVPRAFWAADATSGRFYRFNIATGAIEIGPVNTQSSNLSGICVDGGFSLDQSPPKLFSDTVNADDPTATFPLDELNKLTVTLNGLTNDVTLNFRAAFIHKNAGFSDQEMECTPTEPNDQCIIWNVEATTESGFSSADLQIFQPNTGGNTRVLKNEATDITTFVKNMDPGGRIDTFSVFSLNEAKVKHEVSCVYETPMLEGSVHNLGSSLSFKFRDCRTGPLLDPLLPRLSLVRLGDNGQAAQPVAFDDAGSSGGAPGYRLQPDGTYNLNAKPIDALPGDYLATTFDDSGEIPAFWVQFKLR
jgi:hypothetical protein